MFDFFLGQYNGCYLGAFVSPKLPDTVQYYATQQEMQEFGHLLGKNVSMFLCYLSWEKNGAMTEFPAKWCDEVAAVGAVPHITWEPWDFDRTCNKYCLDTITRGDHDAYIRQFARAVKAYKKQIFLRWAQEMNGFWYPWDGIHNYNEPQRYIDAYIHIHNIFKEEHAKNVSWIWCPEVSGELGMDNPLYNYHNYYPGNGYVDWIGFDGLNFGPTQDAASSWKTFSQLFDDIYTDISDIYPDKPLMIGSMASADLGGNKAEWITDAFIKIKQMKKIKLVTWFNIHKEAHWTIDSSPESLSAIRKSVSDDYFRTLS